MPRSAKRTSASRWAVSERSQRSPTDQALSGMALGLIPAASTTRFAASRAGPIGVTQVRRRVDEIAAFHHLVATLHLGVLFGDGLLDLGQDTLSAEAPDALPMGLAPFSGSADQLLG